MHDPEVYEDPHVFRPERFIRDGKLDPGPLDPASFAFGYGRRYVAPSRTKQVVFCGYRAHARSRICPGRYFAEATLFISIACALHVLDITPPLGEDGRPMKIEHVQSDTLVSCVSFWMYHIPYSQGVVDRSLAAIRGTVAVPSTPDLRPPSC